MKFRILDKVLPLILGLCALPGISAAEPAAPLVIPGRSIGQVALGMTRDAVSKLGLPVTPDGGFGDDVRLVGPYRVVFDECGKVRRVQFEVTDSPAGVRIGAAHLPATANQKALASALPGCEQEETGEGGNNTLCSGGTASIISFYSHKDKVMKHRIDVHKSERVTAPKPPCAQDIGAEQAKQLVDRCRLVAHASRVPCNASNACSVIRDEIGRGCAWLKVERNQARPAFCDEKDTSQCSRSE